MVSTPSWDKIPEILIDLLAFNVRLSNLLSTSVLRAPSVLPACTLSLDGRRKKLVGQFPVCVLLRRVCDNKRSPLLLRATHYFTHFLHANHS